MAVLANEQLQRHTRACACCGLNQLVPEVGIGQTVCCARCGTTLVNPRPRARGAHRTAAIATAALVLYPLAVSLPILRIEQFGHANETSILGGIVSLLGGGHVVLGLVVLVCSVVLPLAKLLALLVLSAGAARLHHHHRARTYHLVHWTGRWGMLDVLLAAVLVAALKLGDLVEVTAGPGAVAFCSVVVLSLAATAVFDPQRLWDDE